MEKGTNKLYEDDEEEIRNVYYVEDSVAQLPEDSSKDNIELSLEVEITDSLKHLVLCPEKHGSDILDVTIVRPSQLRCGEDPLSFKNSEVRKLIAVMERQKQYKKRLIDECRRNVNVVDEEKASPRRRRKRPLDNSRTRDKMTVFSAPPKFRTTNKNIQSFGLLNPPTHDFQTFPRQDTLIIEQSGDRPVKQNKQKEKPRLTSDNSFLNFEKPKTQVYTTLDRHDKLKNLLVCQNTDGHQDSDDKPCPCRHCGMVDLLMESQKRPVSPGPPVKRRESISPKNRDYLRASKKDASKEAKYKIQQENYILFRDIFNRLDALETRVSVQEQQSVPKDYFKKIMAKLWRRQSSSQCVLRSGHVNSSRVKNHSTQYNPASLEEVVKEAKVIKQRNVQIQHKRHYYVNPALIASTDSNSNDSPNKTRSVISHLYTKKSNSGTSKEKKGAIETFWRWGGEVIKPGIDLKTRILSLLDEQFRNKQQIQNEKPETQPKETIDDKQSDPAVPSNDTLKKMLDIMSEKIYNDHIKSTVEANKQEQGSYNYNSNQILNIKAAMTAALCKIGTKQEDDTSQKCKKSDFSTKFLEPLALPSSLRKNSRLKVCSKLYKKTEIPVKVTNASFGESTSGNVKHKAKVRSEIPRLKSPEDVGKGGEGIFGAQSVRKQKRGSKSVQIKYINPKAGNWNNESCASFQAESFNQVMLTNKPSPSNNNECEPVNKCRGAKRRMCRKRSVTDILAFLTKITKSRLGKVQIWGDVLKEAKERCNSERDTVIIQVPTDAGRYQGKDSITEIELTMDDIQRLVRESKYACIDGMPQVHVEASKKGPLGVIRDRHLLELHKRLEK